MFSITRRCSSFHISHSSTLKGVDLRELRCLNSLHLRCNAKLESVAVDSGTELSGLESLSNPKLCFVDGISEINYKTTVWLGKSRRFNLDTLPKHIIRLDLASMGKIPNLAFLRRYQDLEALAIFGTTDISDGDLSILLSMPKLRSVSLQNRKHYSHTQSDIRTALNRR